MSKRSAAAIAVAVLTAAAAAAVMVAWGGSSGNASASASASGSGSTDLPSRNAPPGGGSSDGGFRGMPGGGLGGRPGGGGPGGFEAAATYLGVDPQTLFSQLSSGKSLAEIAEATDGKSKAGLIAAMVEAQQKQLDEAVDAGSLTQAQADQISADLESRVTAMVEGTFGAGRGGFRGPPGSADDGSPPGWGDDGSTPGSGDGQIS